MFTASSGLGRAVTYLGFRVGLDLVLSVGSGIRVGMTKIDPTKDPYNAAVPRMSGIYEARPPPTNSDHHG